MCQTPANAIAEGSLKSHTCKMQEQEFARDGLLSRMAHYYHQSDQKFKLRLKLQGFHLVRIFRAILTLMSSKVQPQSVGRGASICKLRVLQKRFFLVLTR